MIGIFSPMASSLVSQGRAEPAPSRILDTRTMGTPLVCESREAVFFPQELEKITGYAPHRDSELEHALLIRGEHTVPPTLMVLVRDAIVAGGNLYCGRWKLRLTGKTTQYLSLVEPDDSEGPVLVDTVNGGPFFGDWLLDDLPFQEVAQSLGTPVSVFDRKWPHAKQYLTHFGIPTARTILGTRRVKELWVRQNGGISHSVVEAWGRLRGKVIGKTISPGKIYIKRGVLGQARSLVNEDEIEQMLLRQGFLVLEPELLDASRILEMMAGASLVVGVEGSHLAPAILTLQKEGTLLVIQPPNRFNNPYKIRCDILGLGYSFVVGNPCGEGFHVDTGGLQRTIDLVQERVRH